MSCVMYKHDISVVLCRAVLHRVRFIHIIGNLEQSSLYMFLSTCEYNVNASSLVHVHRVGTSSRSIPNVRVS